VKRVPLTFAVTFTLASLGCAGTIANGTARAAPARAATVKLVGSDLGQILVDGSGFTLYMFTRDKRDRDTCAAVSGCLGVWPALTTAGRPIAGAHVKSSLLGTIALRGDIRQVTYAGHPLYTYASDFGRASTLYVGSDEYGGRWYAVDTAGRAVN
jgi:predicted lipoprotein with Yx(FWY)xxD motif